MLERIKKKSLDELEDLIGGFSRDAVGDDILDNAANGSSDGIIANTTGGGDDYSQSRSTSSSRSIIATFSQRTVNDGGQESVFSESVSTSITISSSSIFVPSL
jgi:hypothetical protein